MEKERKRTHRPQGRVPIPALALFAIVLSVAVLFIGSSGSESEAASYGSGTDPYGGLYADWSDLTNGADYYIHEGEPVLIGIGGASVDGLTIEGEGHGLTASPEDSVLAGYLTSSATITIAGKAVHLIAVPMISYGGLPVYGADIATGDVTQPLAGLTCTDDSRIFGKTFFVKTGSAVSLSPATGVTSGFGLTLNEGKVSGNLSKEGVVTVTSSIKIMGSMMDFETTIVSTNGGKQVSSLSISGGSSVDMGGTIVLKPVCGPSDAAFKQVSWKVENTNGTVAGYPDDDGNFVVIGVSEGDVKVTATTRDGGSVTASKVITVNKADINIQTIKLVDHTSSSSRDVTADPDADLIFIDGYKSSDVTISLKGPKEFVNISYSEGGRWVFKPVAGVYGMSSHIFYSGNLTQSDVDFNLTVAFSVTYDANGGLMSNGQSTMTKTTSGPIELAFPSKEGSTFSGWYDAKDGGKLVGKAGSTYTPDGNVTIYAHWDASTLEVVSEFEWAGGQGVSLSYTPKVKDSITGEEITDFKVDVPRAKDQTGCLYADGSRVYGMMKDLIPGTYTAQVIISKTGYASVTQTITITMPVYTLEPIDSKTMVGQKWLTNLTMKPDDAYIESFSVKFNDGPATSAQYDAGMSGNKGFYIVCKEEGIYTVSLVLSAPGIPSSTKTITLRAESSGEYSDPPSISSIKVTRYGGTSSDNPIEPNTYYLSAIGAANYDTIEWDFGDNSEPSTSGLEQIHRFTPGVYTIKCTVTNVTTGQTATASTKLETLDEPSVDTSDMINIGSKYTSSIIRTDYSNPTLVAKTSDGNVVDCFALNKSTLSDGSYAFVVTGVCNEISLVGKTITFTVSSGFKVIKTWSAVVYAQSGADDIKIEASVKYKVDGLKVTLTDIVPNKASMSLMVDWGDGVLDRDSASATFSHEYSAHGNYTVSMLWKWTSSSGEASQREKTLNIDLSSSETPSVVYHANGGKGTMDSQTGSKTYTIQKCAFVRDGMTCNYWNTSPDLTGTTFKAGDKVSPDGTLDLYAVWENEETEDSKDIIRYAACALLLGIVAVIVVRRYVL